MDNGLLLLVFLALTFVMGIIASSIASAKGRSSANWFFIGFLFGPIGVLAAAVASKDLQAIAERGVEQGVNRKCPFCAEVIKSEAIVCKHCGREVQPMEQKIRVETW